MRPEAQEVRLLADAREDCFAEQLDRQVAEVGAQIQLHGLNKA
jgi:hypothetical protein